MFSDAELVYSLKPGTNVFNNTTVGMSFRNISLCVEDGGSEVDVILTPVYNSHRNYEPQIVIGSGRGILENIVIGDIPQLLLIGFLMITGVVLITAGVASRVTVRCEKIRQ